MKQKTAYWMYYAAFSTLVVEAKLEDPEHASDGGHSSMLPLSGSPHKKHSYEYQFYY